MNENFLISLLRGLLGTFRAKNAQIFAVVVVILGGVLALLEYLKGQQICDLEQCRALIQGAAATVVNSVEGVIVFLLAILNVNTEEKP